MTPPGLPLSPHPGPARSAWHALTQVGATGPKAATALRSFGYDGAGNTTSRTSDTGTAQTLAWTSEGQLASVTEGTNSTTCVYDADGNRLIARAPSKTTLYLPDGTELELPTGGGSPLGTRHYADIAVRDTAGLKWVATDHHGTGLVQVDEVTLTPARRRSMPHGEPLGTPPSGWVGTKGYVGGTNDDTGLTHLDAREYDPTLGRFTVASNPRNRPHHPHRIQIQVTTRKSNLSRGTLSRSSYIMCCLRHSDHSSPELGSTLTKQPWLCLGVSTRQRTTLAGTRSGYSSSPRIQTRPPWRSFGMLAA